MLSTRDVLGHISGKWWLQGLRVIYGGSTRDREEEMTEIEMLSIQRYKTLSSRSVRWTVL